MALMQQRTPSKDNNAGSALPRSILERFNVQGMIGEGEFSVAQKAVDKVTGKVVAIKVYKKNHPEQTKARFKRQVEILQELQEPFSGSDDPRRWNDELAQAKVEDLCLQMITCSDPLDSCLCVVLEKAECNLPEYLGEQLTLPLPRWEIQQISQSMMMGVAGLHAKGFVHLDIKPENFMLFGKQWKLIDVEGCVREGTSVQHDDPTIAYSPSYCAPEFARAKVQRHPQIKITFEMDVWSLAMTMGEFATLNSPLKAMFTQCENQGQTFNQASNSVMTWLANTQKAPVFQACADMSFHDLLSRWMLAPNPNDRKTLAECMHHDYFVGGKVQSPLRLDGRRASDPAPSELSRSPYMTPASRNESIGRLRAGTDWAAQSNTSGRLMSQNGYAVSGPMTARGPDPSSAQMTSSRADLLSGPMTSRCADLSSNGYPMMSARLQSNQIFPTSGSFAQNSKLAFPGIQTAGGMLMSATQGHIPLSARPRRNSTGLCSQVVY